MRRVISAAARREKVISRDTAGIGSVDDQMGDPVGHGVGLPGTRAGDDQERCARRSVVRVDAMLDGSSLFTIEGLEIGDSHRWQPVCSRPTRINHVSRFVPTLDAALRGMTRYAQTSSLQNRKHGVRPARHFGPDHLVARYHNSYREQARQYGYEAAADQLGWACPIYVAETDERAREEAGRAVETLFNDFLRQSFEMLMPPGYTSIGSMKNFISMRRGLGGGKATAEGLIESGTALIGSPKTVLAGIDRMRERTGFGILVALLQFGILSDDLTRRNMDLFAAEVMPHLRG
jgi:hypothetical protein